MNGFTIDDSLLNYTGDALSLLRPLREMYPDLEFTNIDKRSNQRKDRAYIFPRNRPYTYARNYIEFYPHRDSFDFVMKKSIMTEAEISWSSKNWSKTTANRGSVRKHFTYQSELINYLVPKLDMTVAECLGSAFVSAHKDTQPHRNTAVSEDTKDADDMIAAVYEIEQQELKGEEREAVVKVRLNQSAFRERLIKRYSRCCLCGVSDHDLLLASHIKPWSESSPSEKLDVDNGFLFCPNHDKLFDKGFISFADDGSILISPELSENDRLFMNINTNMRFELTDKNREYLFFHRNNIFRR